MLILMNRLDYDFDDGVNDNGADDVNEELIPFPEDLINRFNGEFEEFDDDDEDDFINVNDDFNVTQAIERAMQTHIILTRWINTTPHIHLIYENIIAGPIVRICTLGGHIATCRLLELHIFLHENFPQNRFGEYAVTVLNDTTSIAEYRVAVASLFSDFNVTDDNFIITVLDTDVDYQVFIDAMLRPEDFYNSIYCWRRYQMSQVLLTADVSITGNDIDEIFANGDRDLAIYCRQLLF